MHKEKTKLDMRRATDLFFFKQKTAYEIGVGHHRRGTTEPGSQNNPAPKSFPLHHRQFRLRMMRKGRENLLVVLRQGHPSLNAEQLRSRWIARVRGPLRVNDAAARGHPIDLTRLDRLHCPEIVAVHDLAGKQVGHGCKTDMRVWAHFKGSALN